MRPVSAAAQRIRPAKPGFSAKRSLTSAPAASARPTIPAGRVVDPHRNKAFGAFRRLALSAVEGPARAPSVGTRPAQERRDRPFPLLPVQPYLIRREYPQEVPTRRCACRVMPCEDHGPGRICVSREKTAIAPDSPENGGLLHERALSGTVLAPRLHGHGDAS